MHKTYLISGLLAIMLSTGLTACNTQSTQAQQVPAKTEADSQKATDATPQQDYIDIMPLKRFQFKASDGETVYAHYSPAVFGDPGPLIILFHQAGSNGSGEYKNIIPQLIAKGYDVLHIDQRSGGSYFGNENLTVKARGGKTTYCEAYPDMEGALAYAKATFPDTKIFAWGSSYSAALVLKLASEHGEDLAGVLSFSPATGKAMGECNANNFIAGVKTPALGLRPDSEMGSDINKGGLAQRALYKAQNLDYYVAKDGVHGSSMLDPKRANGDVEPTWAAVWAFLDKHK